MQRTGLRVSPHLFFFLGFNTMNSTKSCIIRLYICIPFIWQIVDPMGIVFLLFFTFVFVLCCCS